METMYEYVPGVNLMAHDLKHRMQGIHTDKHIWKDITETQAYRDSSISLSNALLCPCDVDYDGTHPPTPFFVFPSGNHCDFIAPCMLLYILQ